MSAAAEERMFTTGAETDALMTTVVRHLPCRLKKITSTDDGKIALAIELETSDDEIRNQLRALFDVQQGQIEIDVSGVQGRLDI